MIRFVEVIDVPLPLDEAFDAIADFSTTVDWDPGVKSATPTTSAPLRVGSRFRVVVEIFGRTQTYGYAITDYERPTRVVLQGGDAGTRLVDEITFVPRGAGTRITYEVRCDLVGPGRLAEPFVDWLLPIIGRRAAEGLRRYGKRLAARAKREAALSDRHANAEREPAPSPLSHPETEPIHSHEGVAS